MSGDGATFPRLHVWGQNETILPVDLNAEFDNILNNLTFEGLDDYELNVTQMQKQTSPGDLGTEVLATSGAGELERIRFVLARLLGTTYWYQGSAISLAQANTLLNLAANIPSNRIDSGAALPLVASATLNSITLKGSVTSLQFHVSGQSFTVSTDVTFSGLTLGSAANSSKALVNDVSLTAQLSSMTQGENGTVITFDTDGTHTGTDITARLGKVSAFRIVHGGNTEYFLATVASATTLADARRGYFFNSSGNPIPRIAIADEDVITLMQLAYVFVTSGGALAVTYNAPTYSSVQPAIAFAGDYWFNLTTQVWMSFNGSAWVVANATFLGLAIQDSVKTVGTRTTEFFAGYSALNTIVLTLLDSTHVGVAVIGEEISVAGQVFSWPTTIPVWASTGQFAPGASLLPNTTYYAYVTNTGALLLDTIPPYDRTKDLLGLYHPNNTWRAVGFFSTDGGSLFLTPSSYGQLPPRSIINSQILDQTITGAKLVSATITGSNVQNNISLTGKAVQENGLNVVVSASNAGNSLAIIRGGVTSAGALSIGEGFTVAHPGGGVYDISFVPAFLDTPTVVATINGAIGSISTSALNNAGVRITTTDNGFTVVDENFTFIALGQRP